MTALDKLDLTVPEGTIHGLLGPNGAGKTTVVRILSTLLKPDAGRAEVFGFDVEKDAWRVRATIGLTGQDAAVDRVMTGRENLRMFGRLFGLSKRAAAARADELLQRFDLDGAADRQVKTYSGGMRRRLDLAASLMARPRLIFLDEPTTGLDPRSRIQVWGLVRELREEGTTILLTTQYLEEADQLADSLSVIDHGRVIKNGTPDELKAEVGPDWVDVTLVDSADFDTATEVLRGKLGVEPVVDLEAMRVRAPVSDGDTIADMLYPLKDAGVAVSDVALRRPTLDDVFLAVTGRSGEPASNDRTRAAKGARIPTKGGR
ncbi:ATP-binding cassette domain-containing protein [Actinomadura sp. NBRC 104425]|uniref:ATP-binding cassette domain-containing protein n=1 Tax=Actinomadura sp. NBRC 104425 TaxID=3032204 RepID=UPI0025564EC0|nr:ATP-binding cassette domain-containing protein [Actinomadura sp. NBRC 104425]